MKHNCAKKIAGGCFALAMTFALAQPMLADDLNTEMASAGAAVDIQNYISSTGSEDGLSSYLPAPEKTENKTTMVESKKTTNENKLFSNIAIAKVEGGSEGYVNVRRRPSAKGKRVGKIYNNCGATIIEETSNGWYKIKSGNCTGYIKAEYFVTGNKAQSRALDNGYVFANVTATGVHVREKSSTKSDIVTLVVGYLLGAAALGGMLAGALVCGVMMAIFMSNAGGAWDNAKKYIEGGFGGGKGSEAHKAAVVGDTVGDPFKDTSGPSINILIKLMTIVSLVFAMTFPAQGYLYQLLDKLF